MNKEQLENLIKTTGNEDVRRMAQAELQKLQFQEQASKGDELSKVLLALKETVDNFKRTAPAGQQISQADIQKLLKDSMRKSKIGLGDLDEELRAYLSSTAKVKLDLSTPFGPSQSTSDTLMKEFERPLFQKILSDFKARNNVYLYGTAGTGKTYLAVSIANFLGYEYIELNCNQYTSPLDVIGGETIEGYRKGRLEMAWSNSDQFGNPMKGAVLCLDELPKLDPNTAGLLNSALAKIKEFRGGKAPVIRNGKGDVLELKNLFVIATGNTKLNETSVEYEANFKQDLSLQDRFAGSTYEVVVDYDYEFNQIMKGYAFIWLYMVKLREIIIQNKWTGYAFVSIRIMENMRETYKVFRDLEAQKITSKHNLLAPKTLKQSVDSFLNLFKETQIEKLKNESGYSQFIQKIEDKNRMPIGSYDTPEELAEARRLIKANTDLQMRKLA